MNSGFDIPFEIGDFSHILGSSVPPALGTITAASLALREISAGQTGEANLIPREQISVKKEKTGGLITEGEKITLQKWAVGGFLTVATVVLSLHLLLDFQIARHQSDLNNRKIAHTRLTSVPDTSVPQKQLEETGFQLKDKLAFLSALIDRRIFWTSKMNALARVTPPGIRLTNLEYADREDKQGRSQIILKLQGVVLPGGPGSGLEAGGLFVSALKQDQKLMDGFHEVKMSSLRKAVVQNTEMVNFTVEFLASKIKQEIVR